MSIPTFQNHEQRIDSHPIADFLDSEIHLPLELQPRPTSAKCPEHQMRTRQVTSLRPRGWFYFCVLTWLNAFFVLGAAPDDRDRLTPQRHAEDATLRANGNSFW